MSACQAGWRARSAQMNYDLLDQDCPNSITVFQRKVVAGMQSAHVWHSDKRAVIA